MFHIVWPEDRVVSAGQIEIWYLDACANDELIVEDRDLKDPNEQAYALHRNGVITLAD